MWSCLKERTIIGYYEQFPKYSNLKHAEHTRIAPIQAMALLFFIGKPVYDSFGDFGRNEPRPLSLSTFPTLSELSIN